MEIPKKCRTSCGFQLCMRQQCSHTAQYGIDSRYQGLLSLNILWVAAQMSKISFLVPFGFDHLEIQCFFIRILCSLQDAWEGSLPQKGWSWPCDGKSGQITLFIIQNLVKSSFFAGEQSPSTHQDIKKSPGYFLGSVSNTEAFHESTLLLVKPQSNQSNKKCSVLEDVSP